jgi:hypothetical protein
LVRLLPSFIYCRFSRDFLRVFGGEINIFLFIIGENLGNLDDLDLDNFIGENLGNLDYLDLDNNLFFFIY